MLDFQDCQLFYSVLASFYFLPTKGHSSELLRHLVYKFTVDKSRGVYSWGRCRNPLQCERRTFPRAIFLLSFKYKIQYKISMEPNVNLVVRVGVHVLAVKCTQSEIHVVEDLQCGECLINITSTECSLL